MIDIHSHILPGIDDGSSNIKTTLSMLRQAAEDGTKEIVATPHFCRGYGESTYDEVKELVNGFNKVAKSEDIPITIYHGQEVYYSENMIEDYKQGVIGTINNSKYMLFELPMRSKLDSEVFDILYELQIMGLTLILAHPERYKFVMDDPTSINKFIDEGILFQMNAGSVLGKFGPTVKKTANILLENRIYNFIGSDAHDDVNRNTNISESIYICKDKDDIYEELFDNSARNLLNNKQVEFMGKRIKKKKSFGFFFRR